MGHRFPASNRFEHFRSHFRGLFRGSLDAPTDDPDDLDALAAAEHEGQLDRIAVSTAILRRKIMRSRAGRDYTKERMELLRRQVARLDLPSHIKNILLEYLGSAPRSGTART